jgi:hypothetical protein
MLPHPRSTNAADANATAKALRPILRSCLTIVCAPGEMLERTVVKSGASILPAADAVRVSRDHCRAFVRIGLAFALAFTVVTAHEIPADVTVHAFVKPEGNTLRILVRAPLEAMRDVIFPTRDPGFLELSRAESSVRTAAETWIANGVRAYENGQPLGRPSMQAVQLSLPSDRSFESWDQALAHVTGPPLSVDTELLWTQARLDVLLEFAIQSDASEFSIETDFARFGIRTLSVVRFLPPGGEMRVFQYTGDAGRLYLDPRWHQAAKRFVVLGIEHILSGIDHLLFLLCVVVPIRSFKRLVMIATGFTVAHSITMIAASLDFVPSGLWFPPLVETLIALSIVWMALENIAGASDTTRRWVLTFVFGLVHGFGFSFALRETLQFGGKHFVMSLVSFNAGVEVGQILALAAMVPALALLFRYVVAERIGGIIISALVAHQAWHWMTERGSVLFEHGWPFTGWQTVSYTLRAAIVLWIAGWGCWYFRRKRTSSPLT